MPVIIRGLTIGAPPAAVWRVLIDLDRQPAWMHDLKSVTGARDGPLAVGFRAVGHVRMFGVTQDDPIEVTDLEPPRHYGIRHMGGFAGRADFWLEPLPGGEATRVTWREELLPSAARLGLPGFADPLVRRIDALVGPFFELIFRADLRRLRDVVMSAR